MADISILARTQIRPLNGAVIRQFKAGGTVNIGDLVYVASDGDVEQADANSATLVEAIGIVVAISDASSGATAAAAGDAVSVVTFGPVSGFTGLTPGQRLYGSITTGAIADAAPSGAGTWTHVIGYAEQAGVVFVMPGIKTATSNS